ncbi:MAG: hypothetical protein P1U56_09535 [Saprospiraceae bacterium]|nr:hypothetical protein [Saprospiraceae bacterium]
MNKEELDILMDKSVLGTLSAEEKTKLENHIMEQPTTQLEIQMREDIIKGFDFNQDQDLRSILDQIHQEEIKTPTRTFSLYKFTAAAVLIGVLLASYFIFITNSSNPIDSIDGAMLYASHYEIYSPSSETRSDEITIDPVMASFITAYRNQEYDKSLSIIEPLIKYADNNTLLLAGISALELEKYTQSITYFDQIIESQDYYYSDHAKWYKALLLIKTEKFTAAKALIKELAEDPKADHHDESVSLLNKF